MTNKIITRCIESQLSTSMEMYKSRFIATALLLSTVSMMVGGQDFVAARTAVANAAPNIDYDEFCSESASGQDKLACRIKTVPSVGFLVCKTPEIDAINCSDILNTEIKNIQTIKADGIETVEVSPPPIAGVKCGNKSVPFTNCSGFLEAWVADGLFQQIRDRIVKNETTKLISDVKDFTTGSLQATANDLTTIQKYMEVNPAQNKYRQICDLQGFFMKAGGFIVNDVPLLEELGLNDSCPADEGEQEPTTEVVLDNLKKMIGAFSESRGMATKAGSPFNLGILLISFCFTALFDHI